MGVRTSIFIGTDLNLIEAAAKIGTDRIELYTEPYAENYAKDREKSSKPICFGLQKKLRK